jgi:hypothetical protein
MRCSSVAQETSNPAERSVKGSPDKDWDEEAEEDVDVDKVQTLQTRHLPKAAEVNLDKLRRRTVGGSLPRSISARVIPVLNGIIKHSGRTCTTLSIWGKEQSGSTRQRWRPMLDHPLLQPPLLETQGRSHAVEVGHRSRHVTTSVVELTLLVTRKRSLCWTCRFSRPSSGIKALCRATPVGVYATRHCIKFVQQC